MTAKHWGKADFTCNPMTGQWSCAHCRAELPDNRKLCKCQKGKKP